MIQWTGERYVPWVDNAGLSYEHLSRYLLAKEYAKNKMVLDMACGEGYGSFILSDVAGFVVGIDIDPDSVDHARTKYQRGNLVFVTSERSDVTLQKDHGVDLIVCFEALEHMDKHVELMREVKRLLKSDGIFIVSTPDKKTYSDDRNYKNPFHTKELYLEEFRSLLSSSFKHTSILGQRIYNTASIFPLSGPSPVHREFAIELAPVGYREADPSRRQPLYYIAICSDAPLDAAAYGSATLYDLSNSQFRGYDTRIAGLTAELQAARQKAAGVASAAKPAETAQPEPQRQAPAAAPRPAAEETLRTTAEQCVLDRKYEDALEIFMRLTRDNPEDQTLWNDMGVVYAVLGRFEQAGECLNKALSLKADYTEASDNLLAVSRLELERMADTDKQ